MKAHVCLFFFQNTTYIQTIKVHMGLLKQQQQSLRAILQKKNPEISRMK